MNCYSALVYFLAWIILHVKGARQETGVLFTLGMQDDLC